jgi:inosine-uridine nucleoside N-ribohydrolase
MLKEIKFMIYRFLIPVLILLGPAMSSAKVAEQRPIPVLLSTDMGNEIDDQWPLVHLLTNPRFQVVGIASAHAPPGSIPGGAGTSARLIRNIVKDRLRPLQHPPIVHGADEKLSDDRTPRRSEAVEFMIEASRGGYSTRERLNLLVIGAATDAASALIIDPSLADRVRIVAMGFRSWEAGGDEFNVRNDPAAWRVILNSRVPLVVGDSAVATRHLSLTRGEAADILRGSGAIQPWLLRDYDAWYERHIKGFEAGKRPDGSYSWPIWDHVVVAYLLGFATVEERPRPRMGEDLKFAPAGDRRTIGWVTAIDRDQLFADFNRNITLFARTHATRDPPCYTIASEPLACWRVHNGR